MSTNWDEEAEKAGDEADAKLSGRMDKLLGLDLSAAYPDPADRTKVEELVKVINSKTERNERLAAFKGAGLEVFKLLEKALLCLILGLFMALPAMSQEVPVARPMLDFGSFFMKSRVGYSINQHMERSTVLYSAFKRYNAKPGVELANLNFGYDTSNKHPVVMLGVRLDNADRLLWSGSWAKKHIESAPLPVIEFGPDISAWPRVESGKVHLDYWYGFVLAMGVN